LINLLLYNPTQRDTKSDIVLTHQFKFINLSNYPGMKAEEFAKQGLELARLSSGAIYLETATV